MGYNIEAAEFEIKRLQDANEVLRARVRELELRISPCNSIPLEDALGTLKPCPFCGSEAVGCDEGEAFCRNCNATNDTMGWQFRAPIA